MRSETTAIRKALRARFCAPEWACFFEVPQATGAMAGRTADAIAMNCYPSRGLRIHGVEIKAYRGDWLRELKTPDKAEPIQRYCDHWWIAAPKGVVLDGELPPTWGLLELNGAGLRQTVAAPLLKAEDLSRAFVASLLRSAAGRAAVELHEATREARESEIAKVAERVEREVQQRTRQHEELKSSVTKFEAESGISIASAWGYGAGFGKAVRLVRELGIDSIHSGIRKAADSARKFADKVDASLPPISEINEVA